MLANVYRMDEMMRGHRGWRELHIVPKNRISKISEFFGDIVSPKVSENKATEINYAVEDNWIFEKVCNCLVAA